jgi:hypothetical protein
LSYRPRISPQQAQFLIEQEILKIFEVVALSEMDYRTVVRRLVELGIMGGATYDALATQAGAKANVDCVVTLNAKDFRRVHPELASKVVTP